MNQLPNITAPSPWSEADWERLEQRMRQLARAAASEAAAREIIAWQARRVLRTYSTSFFIVTRFLPPAKRARVEIIYAAVRYPDEIVDSFPLAPAERGARLARWGADYEAAVASPSIAAALDRNVPCFLAGFAHVMRETGIPAGDYWAFLAAMRHDIWPQCFETLEDLIDTYIYGSAVVVGYFLTHVYGASRREHFERARASARHLGIALQLTNFLRDVAEDQRRGRLYLPLDMLRGEGIEEADATDPRQHAALHRVVNGMTRIAEDHYAGALADLDAFAPDCQMAIRACINVYRRLNQRIAASPRGILHRESVPTREKLKSLPASKYWRLPLAYLTR